MKKHLRNLAFILPLTIVCILSAFNYLSILDLNDGMFVFTLDDAYIHLSLAEEITHGNYGINPNEIVAPSSSILFPFILAGLLSIFKTDSIALVMNFLLSLISAFVIYRITDLILPGIKKNYLIAINCILIFTANLVNHVFNGMEHSLQILLTLLLIYGIIKEREENKLNVFLFLAIILTPLIRYEALAFSFTAICYLCIRNKKYIVPMLISGVSMIIPVVLFSLFLVKNGLDFLPSSIMIKTGAASNEYGTMMIFQELASHLKDNFFISLLLITIIYIIYIFKYRTKENLLTVAFILLPIFGHLLFGKYRWFYRYEVYIILSSLIYMLFVIKMHYKNYSPKLSFNRAILIYTVVIFLISTLYAPSTFLVPGASNNIYEQHYQMHRFATDFYKKNIGVNDVGFVSYKNDNYVLDFVGLASKEVTDYRKKGLNILTDLPAKHDIHLFIIYESWYKQKPKDWVLLGNLQLSRTKITPADSIVAFYTNDVQSLETVKSQLREWSKGLPGKSTFTFVNN